MIEVNKKIVLIIIILALATAIIYISIQYWGYRSDIKNLPLTDKNKEKPLLDENGLLLNNTASNSSGIATGAASVVKNTASKKTVAKQVATTTPTPVPTLTYADAVKKFREAGYLFQFLNCKSTPGSLIMKVGKEFMIDNRDGVKRKIGIFSLSSYDVDPYSFIIIKAPQTPGQYYLTCDGGGAGSISVQQ